MTLATHLKKALLLMVLFGLVLVEAGLLEGFLPYKWQHAISQQSERIFPSKSYDPHPDMAWEFELDFRQHPWHRTIEYAVLGILALGDAYLISKLWRALRRLKSPASTS